MSEPPASRQAPRIASASSFAASVSPFGGVVEHERVEVAVAGVEDVADAEPVLARELADPPQHLGQLRPRDDAVLHVVVGRHPAHRREGALAAEPEQRPLGVVARDPHLEGAAVAADPVDGGRVLLDLHGDAVELDEQERLGVLRVAGVVGLLGRDDRERVHHLDRGGQDPGRDDRGDGLARRVDRRGTPRGACVTASGLRTMRSVISRRDPERALGADEGAEQVGPVRVERLAAELDELAVGEHDRQPGDVVDREAVLEAVRAARVLGDVAADRADLLARRVGGVEEAVGRDGARDVEVGDARLDHDPLRLEVDLEDPVHPRERDDDPLRHGQRAAREAGAGAARDEGHALARADAGRPPAPPPVEPGRTTSSGVRAPAREPVAVVDAQLLGLGDHVRGRRRRR